MGKLLIKDKEIVVPGQILATGMDFLPAGGAFRDKEEIISSQVGIVNISGRLIKLIPLTGRYVPKKNDTVIGKVSDMSFSSWYINIGYASDATLMLKEASGDFIPRNADLTQYYNFGDYVVAKIINVNKAMHIDLTMKGPGLKKLSHGKIIKVTPVKVPRIIGKQGSMISLVKDNTGCRIMIGQNGVVWISGVDPEKERIATEAIMMINESAHESGLTDKVKAFLEGKVKKNVIQKKK